MKKLIAILVIALLAMPALCAKEMVLGKFTDEKGQTKPIKWTVLSESKGTALLLCKDSLGRKQYNEISQKTSWEESTVCKYLNGEFLKKCFTKAERQKILKKEGIKVRLLTVKEAEKYLKKDKTCFNIFDKDKRPVWWWLKDSGVDEIHAAFVEPEGTINKDGFGVATAHPELRPVIAVKTK